MNPNGPQVATTPGDETTLVLPNCISNVGGVLVSTCAPIIPGLAMVDQPRQDMAVWYTGELDGPGLTDGDETRWPPGDVNGVPMANAGVKFRLAEGYANPQCRAGNRSAISELPYAPCLVDGSQYSWLFQPTPGLANGTYAFQVKYTDADLRELVHEELYYMHESVSPYHVLGFPDLIKSSYYCDMLGGEFSEFTNEEIVDAALAVTKADYQRYFLARKDDPADPEDFGDPHKSAIPEDFRFAHAPGYQRDPDHNENRPPKRKFRIDNQEIPGLSPIIATPTPLELDDAGIPLLGEAFTTTQVYSPAGYEDDPDGYDNVYFHSTPEHLVSIMPGFAGDIVSDPAKRVRGAGQRVELDYEALSLRKAFNFVYRNFVVIRRGTMSSTDPGSCTMNVQFGFFGSRFGPNPEEGRVDNHYEAQCLALAIDLTSGAGFCIALDPDEPTKLAPILWSRLAAAKAAKEVAADASGTKASFYRPKVWDADSLLPNELWSWSRLSNFEPIMLDGDGFPLPRVALDPPAPPSAITEPEDQMNTRNVLILAP